MIAKSRARALLVLSVLTAAAACSTKDEANGNVDASFGFDGTADFEGGGDDASEAASPEAAVEAGPQDATVDVTMTVDSGVVDSTVVDVAVEAGVDAAPEAAVEASMPEAAVDAAVDSGVVVEAGLDAAPEAAVEAGPDAEAGVDAAVSCITQVFGDHYVRADGTAVYAGLGQHVVIVDGNGARLSPISEIVQNSGSACGLRSSDGTVWCWPLTSGYTNPNGALGNGTLAGSGFVVGTASQVVMGAVDGGLTGPLTGVQHLSTRSNTFYEIPTCAIGADRTLWCWGVGSSSHFQGTTGSTASVPYALPIAAGPTPSDGGPTPLVLADQVAVGLDHACIVSAKQASCWGSNISGNLGNGDVNLSFQPYPLPVVNGPYGFSGSVDQIGCGYRFTCMLSGGAVWCFGTDGAHQEANPSVPEDICNLNYCHQVPTPVQVDLPDGGSSQVPDAGGDQYPLTGVTQLLTGYQFACGLMSDGTLDCWGAIAAGSNFVPEARPYTNASQPYAGITSVGAAGEDWSALRYTTSSGVYVQNNTAVTPYCQ